MSKQYLAFKGTDKNLQSAWVPYNVVRMQYEIGKTFETRKELPMYLAKGYRSDWELTPVTGCNPERLLLVRVDEENISKFSPWYRDDSKDVDYQPKSVEELLAHIYDEGYAFTATRLTVLEEAPMSDFPSMEAAMRHYEQKYNLERFPARE